MSELAANHTEDKDDTGFEHSTADYDLSSLFDEQTIITDNPGIIEARAAVFEALTGSDVAAEQLRSAWGEYAKTVEGAIDAVYVVQQDPMVRLKLQIAAHIHKALVFRDAGNTLRYLEELDTADVSAFIHRLHDISRPTSAEIDAEVEKLDISPEVVVLRLRGKLEEKDRYLLWDLVREGIDLDGLIGHVRAMLAGEDKDPDVILTEIGITEG